MRENAARLGLDAERVALWGSSAGGYLALAAALAGPEPAGRPLRLIADPPGGHQRPEGLRYDVRGVVAHYPVTSPAGLRDDAFDNSPAEIEALERALGVFFAGHDHATVDLAARARLPAVFAWLSLMVTQAAGELACPPDVPGDDRRLRPVVAVVGEPFTGEKDLRGSIAGLLRTSWQEVGAVSWKRCQVKS